MVDQVKKKEISLKNILKSFKSITKDADQFLNLQQEKCDDIRQLIQHMYRKTVLSDTSNIHRKDILSDLIVEDLDEEQIWQQLELRNNIVIPLLLEQTSQILSLREEKFEIRLDGAKEDDDPQDPKSEEEGNDYSNFEEASSNSKKQKKSKYVGNNSSIEDKFFKLDEMEAFLEAEESKEVRRRLKKPVDDDGIDFFADSGRDSEEDIPNYKDFFDDEESGEEDTSDEYSRTKDEDAKHDNGDDGSETQFEKRISQLDSESESYESENEDCDNDEIKQNETKTLSTFQQREVRLQQRIRNYEDELLGEKPWQLKGEIKAINRPQNSLLEEILEFESATRPAPVITEVTTHCIEDIIRQRIKDQAWDDVVPKVRTVQTPQECRKQLVLDQEKSKQSLAQIYEKDYQREMDKIDPNYVDNGNVEEPKEHQEIRLLMRTLFLKLDALSNFHFVPKPIAPEPKIITNVPAVAMEEVAPVAVSDAKLLAPEEIFRGPKHQPLGKSERTRTDKNRELRKKKQKQHAIHKFIEQRQNSGKPLSKKDESTKLLKAITKNRNTEKIITSNDHGSLKSSKAFFTKLQEETNNRKAGDNIAMKRKTNAMHMIPKKLKL